MLTKLTAIAFAVAAVTMASIATASPVAEKQRISTSPTKFASKLYGYSLVLPASRWSLHPATSRWSQEQPQPGEPWADTLTDQAQDRFFLLGAQNVPEGVGPSAAGWTAYFIPGALACAKTSPISSTRLGGAPAKTYTFKCGDVVGTAINAVHDGEGYYMILGKHTQGPAAAVLTAKYRAELQAVRRSFRFAR